MQFVVLDTETTGRSFFKGDRLIEIGACKYINRSLVSEYHTYINPECLVSEGALRVHGLSDQFLKDKPLFNDVAADFLSFISGSVLVIHNAAFDLGFLDNELSDAGFSDLSSCFKVVDTLAMARKLYPGQRNNLDALCRRLGVDNAQRLKHGALLDARLLAEVYLIMTACQNKFMLAQDSESCDSIAKKHRSSFVQYASPSELELHRDFMQKLLFDAVDF